jgi:hypothetical protein
MIDFAPMSRKGQKAFNVTLRLPVRQGCNDSRLAINASCPITTLWADYTQSMWSNIPSSRCQTISDVIFFINIGYFIVAVIVMVFSFYFFIMMLRAEWAREAQQLQDLLHEPIDIVTVKAGQSAISLGDTGDAQHQANWNSTEI